MALYMMEIYDRKEGDPRPTLLEKCRVIAANDAEAITQSKKSFVLHDTPSVTGFVLSSAGLRSSHNRIVYDHVKKLAAVEPIGANMVEEDRATEMTATTRLAEIAATGEKVSDVPPCVGFD